MIIRGELVRLKREHARASYDIMITAIMTTVVIAMAIVIIALCVQFIALGVSS